MSQPRYEDWQLLDLTPDAEFSEINRALHYRRALYQPGALATYNLLDEDERVRMLERIDEAYQRITGNAPPPRGPRPSPATVEVDSKPPSGPAPDPRTEPGSFLRHHRRRKGLSLEALATETKIRPVLIEQLESEAVNELPAAVFVRGHVLQVARALELPDPNEIAAWYLAKVKLD